MTQRVLWYDLKPYYEPKDGDGPMWASAALRTCIVTGRILDTMGGPGYSMSPEIVARLDMSRYGCKPKAVMDIEDVVKLLNYIVSTNPPQEMTDLVMSIKTDAGL